jgi:hypothetical protein
MADPRQDAVDSPRIASHELQNGAWISDLSKDLVVMRA